MPRARAPVAEPVVFNFDNGTVQLTSVIDPETLTHLMTCDLCDQSVNLGKRGSAQPMLTHRESLVCRTRTGKAVKNAAKNRNLVIDLVQ